MAERSIHKSLIYGWTLDLKAPSFEGPVVNGMAIAISHRA